MKTDPIRLTERERAELGRRAKSRAGRADDARIARVLLLLADGVTYREIASRVDCSEPFISKWKKRFLAERLAGLYVRHEGRPVTVLTPKGGGADPELDAQEARPTGRRIGARGAWPRSSASTT